MIQTDKELLLQDLYARLPYNVHVDYKGEIYGVLGISCGRLILCKPFMSQPLEYCPLIEEVKPYLFPMSSMTEEQKKFFKDRPIFLDSENELVVKEDFFGNNQFTMLDDWMEVILWLLKNHFDYRGLIPKELAIDCTNLNIY